MVLINSVVLEDGLYFGSSHGRTESVANFIFIYLFIYTFHVKTGYWQNNLMKKCSPIKMH